MSAFGVRREKGVRAALLGRDDPTGSHLTTSAGVDGFTV
jgi:hypothetical protein